MDRRWKHDDNNQTKSAEATFDLVTNQSEYGVLAAIPDAAQDIKKIFGVTVKDSTGQWVNLTPVDREEIIASGISWDEYQDVSSTPSEYLLEGTQLFLKPAPSYDSNEGGKIYLQRHPVVFTASDTTKVPGIDTSFHYLFSLYGQREWYRKIGDFNKMTAVQNAIEKGIKDPITGLLAFYANRMAVPQVLSRGGRKYR